MATRYTDQHPQFTVFVNGVFSPASDGEVEFFTVGNTGESNRKNTFNTPNPSTPPLTSEINQNPVPLDGEGRTTVPVFLEGTYNTIIRDKAGNQIDQVDNVTGLGGSGGEGVPSATIENVAELREVDTLSIQNAYVISTATAGDGGQGHFYFDENSTESDNGVDVIEPTVGGGRWLLQNNAHNSFMYEIASGTTDGITIDPSPNISSLDNTRVFFVQSLGLNTLVAPTFQVGTSTQLTLVRDSSTALEVGATGNAGYTMIIKLSDDDSEYILLNPFNIRSDDIQYINNTIPGAAIVTGSITALQMDTNSVNTDELVANSATNVILADMAQDTIKGRITSSTGEPEDLTPPQGRTVLGLGNLSIQDTVNQSTIDAASVGQAQLRTTTGAYSFVLSTSSLGDLDSARSLVAAGQYGFYPQIGLSCAATGSLNQKVGIGLLHDADIGNLSSITEATYISGSAEQISGGAGTVITTVTATQRYISASPPYNIGDGDIANFTYLVYDKNNQLVASYVADTPPWAYNGPTNIMPDLVKRNEVNNELIKLKKQYKKIVLPPWRGGNEDEWNDWNANKEFEFVEIDHEMKNRDMDLIPHPYPNLREGDYVVLVEPCCDITDKFKDLHEDGESIYNIIKDGYIELKEEVNCCKPNGVKVMRPKWK